LAWAGAPAAACASPACLWDGLLAYAPPTYHPHRRTARYGGRVHALHCCRRVAGRLSRRVAGQERDSLRLPAWHVFASSTRTVPLAPHHPTLPLKTPTFPHTHYTPQARGCTILLHSGTAHKQLHMPWVPPLQLSWVGGPLTAWLRTSPSVSRLSLMQPRFQLSLLVLSSARTSVL